MRKSSESNKLKGKLDQLQMADVVVLRYTPDTRQPERVHLFYPGGFLPKLITRLIRNETSKRAKSRES